MTKKPSRAAPGAPVEHYVAKASYKVMSSECPPSLLKNRLSNIFLCWRAAPAVRPFGQSRVEIDGNRRPGIGEGTATALGGAGAKRDGRPWMSDVGWRLGLRRRLAKGTKGLDGRRAVDRHVRSQRRRPEKERWRDRRRVGRRPWG